jgi:acetyl-CoA C-acetyltransferase
VAWPYLKLMCANPQVDQAGAAVVTTVGRARRLGIPLKRAVYLWGGVAAADELDVLARPTYTRSCGMEAVLSRAGTLAGRDPADFDEIELYSCFPVVPWAAREALGLPPDRMLTTAGGLTFYGGPASSYMNCAATMMVRALRARGGDATGLLYGNGLFMTKHHALVVSTAPPPMGRLMGTGANFDPRPAPNGPALTTGAKGAATIESCTVLAGADGEWAAGIVVGRTSDGNRFVANTPADADTFAGLTRTDRHPVGLPGRVARDGPGLNTFVLTGDST